MLDVVHDEKAALSRFQHLFRDVIKFHQSCHSKLFYDFPKIIKPAPFLRVGITPV